MELTVLTSLLLILAAQKAACVQSDENATSVLCLGECSNAISEPSFLCANASCERFPAELIFTDDVRTIDVSFNKITSLPALAFPKLVSLDLSNNAITDIKAGTFDLCPSLEYLNLSTNVLTSITKQMFGLELRRLVELDLSHNRIASIGQFAFQFLPALKVLNFSDNRLQRLEENVFFSSELEILHLEKNSLSSVRYHYFQDLRQLQYLSLRNNDIRSIDDDSFMVLDNLERLDLGANDLEDIRSDVFHEGVRRPFSQLQTIHLDGNRLRTIRDGTFSPFPRLRYVFLGDNELEDIGRDRPFPDSLAEVDLRGNAALKAIRNGTFSGLAQLRLVNLSNCYKLTVIEAGAFDGERSSVAEFDVGHCSLLHLSPVLLNWSKTTVLRLSDNRWDCDCNLNWTKTTLPETVLKTMHCSSPHQLKGQSLFDVDVKSMSCDFYTRYGYSISVALILAATVLFLSGMAMVACRYRTVLFGPCCKQSQASYRTLYQKAPEDDDYSDPAVSIQVDEACAETKLLKNVEPTQV